MNDERTITAQEASSGAKSLAKLFRSAIALGDYLDQVGSIEAATREAEQARDKAVADTQVAADALAAELARAQDAAQRNDKTLRQAADLTAKSEAQAAERRAQSEADAQEIIAKATARANDIDERANVVRVESDRLVASLADARQEYATLTANVAKIKGEFAKLVS